MAKNSESRRAWIKNVAIIFLTVLLLLTFFSNTILNISLPEVSARYASYGTLTTAVRVDATVKANASYNVIYEAPKSETESGNVQSRKVISVFVKEGQYVEKDAPIMELMGGATEEVKSLQSEYDSLKREYDLALLNDNVTSLTSERTLSEARKAVEDAKKELTKLEEAYKALQNGTDQNTYIERQIEALEEELEILNEEKSLTLEKLQQFESQIGIEEGKIETDLLTDLSLEQKLYRAEEEYKRVETFYSAVLNDLEYCEEKLDLLRAFADEVAEANSLTEQLNGLKEQRDNLQKQFDRDEEDFNAEKAALDAQIAALQPAGPSDELAALESRLATLEKNRDRAREDDTARIAQVDAQIATVQGKIEILGMPELEENVDYALEQEIEGWQTRYDETKEELDAIAEDYEEKKARVESLKEQVLAEENIAVYESKMKVHENDLDYLEEQIKSINKELTAAKEELAGLSTPKDPKALAEQIGRQKENVADLEGQLKITEATQTQANTATNLARQDQKKRLEELKAKIEAYQNAPTSTSIVAPISGKIVSVSYMPGSTVTSGNTVATIEIADQGYVCEVSMAAEEARKIQVGAPCTVVNNWWYNEVSASVTQIRPDPASQGKNRIVVIEVTGDVTEGQSIKFSIGDKSQSYDTVLPNSAIREDNEGKFVLVVEAKDSPLGTRYTARRVDIEILASDDTQSAVTGLYGSEFVITNSEQPIAANQRVRLAENN